jgi:anti-sigma-K factor RskA
MTRWRLMIVAASAVAALAVGLHAQAGPMPDDLQSLLALLSPPTF